VTYSTKCATFQEKGEASGNREKESHQIQNRASKGKERSEGEEGDWRGDLARL
jgi:hypothetical protein